MNKLKEVKGITLIALVITIIVLLILAGVSIATLSGQDGILSKASESKEKTEVSSEKEGIGLSVSSAKIGNNGYENLSQTSLQNAINSQFGEGKATVTDNGDGSFTVKMNNTAERKYTVEDDGNVIQGEYDKWNGTALTEPTEKTDTEMHINKASELKWLADQVNNSGKTFEGYTIYLENNLDLGAREDNGNWETAANETVEWTAIGKVKNTNMLKATFEGNNHIIKGVYVNTDTNFNGIFGNANTITNLTIKNSYIKGASCTAGIVGALRSGKVENCHNVNTTCILIEGSNDTAAGVVGQAQGEVINCSNNGKITAYGIYTSGNSQCGGVVGSLASGTINNCYNTGTVIGNGDYTGGVAGYAHTSSTVSNSYNTGTVTGNGSFTGGVVGCAANIVTKCYNTGNVTGGGIDGVGGIVGSCITKIPQNISLCYNSGTVTSSDGVGGISGYLGAQGYAGTETKCYNKGKIIATGTSNQVGGVIGNMANDANVTKSFYLASIGLTKGVGAINSPGDLTLQNQGAQATDVDLKTFDEFMLWIEQQ